MTTVFILHGAFGNPDENWQPWLKDKLEGIECNVIIPQFPTPENQNLDNWLQILKSHKNKINTSTIFVAHSIAVAFVLNVLEKRDIHIGASFFIAGWTGLLHDDLDKINKTFIDRQFNWNKIKNSCKHFYSFSSDNDPYIPLELGVELAHNLGIKPVIVKNAGHFNEKAGYKTFQLLLDKIEKELQEVTSD